MTTTRVRFDAATHPGRDVDDVLVPIVLDALDTTDAALSRTPRTSQEPDPIDRTPRVAYGGATATTTWRTESPTGAIREATPASDRILEAILERLQVTFGWS